MLTNKQYENVQKYIRSGKTTLARGYKTCNMEKIAFWNACKRAELYYGGELKVIDHYGRKLTAGIMYERDGEWYFIFMDGKTVDGFKIGTARTLARMEKTARKGWWHNPANTNMIRIAY